MGVVSLRQLLLAHPSKLLREVMNSRIIRTLVTDSQETVAKLVDKYRLLAIPVVDEEGILLGMVTVDDVINVIEDETTREMLAMAGTSSSELLTQSPLNIFKLRAPWLIPAAHALLAFPFVVRSLLPALRALDPRLRDAARVLGARPWQVLRAVDLPLLYPALLVGAVFSFTVSLGDFGAALLLARPEYPTVPVVIGRLLGQPGAANYGQALALSTILMLISALGFVALERLRFREVGEF